MPSIKDPVRAKVPAALAAAALLLALLVLAAVLLGLALARPRPTGAQAAPGSSREIAGQRAGTGQRAATVVPGTQAASRGTHAELAARLRDIVQVREQAFARRDAMLLETIYTPDCPCLRAGRAAIAGLLSDRAVWRGRSVSVEAERLSRVSDGLWIVIAVFSSRAFRIEREDGTLLRTVPAERQRYRFVLARPGGRGAWLLGHASLLEDLGT